MVFGEDPDYPIYVIRKITNAHELRSSRTDRLIYGLAGNLVPTPVGCYELFGESYDVQRGVKGSPWFQLRSKINSSNTLTLIEKRIWETLHDFQSAVQLNESSENSVIEPSNEIAKVYQQYTNCSEDIHGNLSSLIYCATGDLSLEPACIAVPQHGDFCLNNLIIDTDHITVIDFEDFNITGMPLYDHFTLALSLPSCETDPNVAALAFQHPHIIEAANGLGVPEKSIPWHYLHHLLLRLGAWSLGDNRFHYRNWLTQVLKIFIDNNIKNAR